jgi:DNA polymerase-3 subunit alpha
VELDRRAGDETPRVTIKRFQPLDSLAKRTRLEMTVRASNDHIPLIARELSEARGGNGVVRFVVPLANGGQATMLAGRDFELDGELADRIARISGEGSVTLSAQEPPRLALVS